MSVGIGTVENQALFLVFSAGFHHVVHRAGVGVVAHAHVLNVENNDINSAELFGRGLFVFTVERSRGQACFCVYAVFNSFARAGIAPKTVFGRENDFDFYAQCQQTIGQVAAIRKNAGVIDHQSHVFVFQQGQIRTDAFTAQNERRFLSK